MKITKIHYFFTAPNNMYWNKIGAEAEIQEGDDVRQCLYDLKKQVEDFFYESKGADEKKKTQQIAETQASPKSQEETIIEGINSCTELNVLKSYELIAKNAKSGGIKLAYETKHQKLLHHNSQSMQSYS